MNNTSLCVGADIHEDDIFPRGVDKLNGHEVIEPFHATTTCGGGRFVAATLAQVATQWGYTRIEIGCEATGMLCIPFHRLLASSSLMQPFEVELVCFNPKPIAHFKDGLVLRGPKSDHRDAFDVAPGVRFGEWPDSHVPHDFWQGLRRLTRYRFQPSRMSFGLSREKRAFAPMRSSSAVTGNGSGPPPISSARPTRPC